MRRSLDTLPHRHSDRPPDASTTNVVEAGTTLHSAAALAILFGGGASLFADGYLLARFNRTGGLDVPWLGHLLPWQAVFVVIGIPGLLLALLILLCLREPARREGDNLAGGTIPLRDVLRFIGRDSGYLPAYLGAYACILAAFFSLITWYPTLAIRSAFGSAASLGPKLGLTFLVCGLMGSVSAQWFVGRASDAQIVQRVLSTILIAQASCSEGRRTTVGGATSR